MGGSFSSGGGIFGNILGPGFLGLTGTGQQSTQQVKLDPTTQALNLARLRTVSQLPTDQLLQQQQQFYTPSQQAQSYLDQIAQAGRQPTLSPQDWYSQSLQGLNPQAQQEQLGAIAQQRQGQLQSALGQQIAGQSAGLGNTLNQWVGAGQQALGTGLQTNIGLAQAGYNQGMQNAGQGLQTGIGLANAGYGQALSGLQGGLQTGLGLNDAGYWNNIANAGTGLNAANTQMNLGYNQGMQTAEQGYQRGVDLQNIGQAAGQNFAQQGLATGTEMANAGFNTGRANLTDVRDSNLNYINNVIGPQAIGAGNSYYNQILGPQLGNENALMGLARSGGRQEAEGKGAANIALQLQQFLGGLQGNTLQGYQQGQTGLAQGLQQGYQNLGQGFQNQYGQIGANYQQGLGQVGANYQGALQQTAGSYQQGLAQAGLGYQGQLGQAAGQYTSGLQGLGQGYLSGVGQAGNTYQQGLYGLGSNYQGQLGQVGQQYAGQLGQAGQQYAGGLADLQNQAYGQYGQNLNTMYGQAYGQYGQGLQGIGSDLSQGQQAYGQQALQNTYGLNQAYPSMDAALRAAQLGYLQQGYQAADIPRQLGQTGFEAQRQLLASIFNSTPYTPAPTTTTSGTKNEGILTSYLGGSGASGAGAAAGAAIFGSDSRLKKNVKKFTADTVLDKLVPYSFEYIDPAVYGTGPQVGIMAQDLEKSELGKTYVLNTPEGRMVYYQKMNSLLLACIVDLHQRIKELESHGV
jgi:Chaperone of endosialidase